MSVEQYDSLLDRIKQIDKELNEIADIIHPDGDEHDHIMQAHFRLTEVLAHVRVSRWARKQEL